jgi:hypothetical protein
MEEKNIEQVLQAAQEKFPQAKPRIISDNGPLFIAKDFKVLLRLFGLTHVKTSPGYPQSNGKLERFQGSLKQECIQPASLRTLDEARARVNAFIEHYNNVRLHSDWLSHASCHAVRTHLGNPYREGSEAGGRSSAPPNQTTSGCAGSCFGHGLRLKPKGRCGVTSSPIPGPHERSGILLM